MKRFAILLAVLILQTQIGAFAAASTDYNKQPAQKTQNVNNKQQQQQPKQQAAPAKNEEYLLKYNINDLEAAPWLNGGKRKI